mgnify:CR=1 FL=1
MSDRKREILQMAIEIIEDEGYGSLSMRGLARASGMKLGALQYHFRTWEDMLRALVDHIDTELSEGFQQQVDDSGSPSVLEIAAYMLDESGQGSLFTDRLWPQLWAMEQVEPLVSDLLEDVYAEYLRLLEQALVEKDSKSALQEWAHARALNPPTYTQVSRSGADHDPTFTVQVEIAEAEGGPQTGQGSSRRAAEQRAAATMLKAIGQ